jgi:hypothetical protein
MASRISPRSTAVSLAALASFCGIASAGDTPNFLMTWDASNDGIGPNTYNWSTFGSYNGYGDWTVGEGELQSGPWTGHSYSGQLPGPGGNTWDLQWNCVFNNAVGGVAAGGSAFVTANIVVTNTDVINQNFTLLMTLPVAAKVYPGERGSIIGTVTDIFGDGATVLAPVGSRIYTPRIDGVNEVPGYLMSAPFSQAAGPFLSATVGPQSFGIVAPSQAIDTSIAIFLSFDLTPGDSASFTSIYEILIPGPGGLAAFAAFGLLRRRRR